MLWFQVAISSCITLLGTVWWTDRFATNVRSPSCLMGVNLVNTFNIKLPDDNVRNRSIHHLYWTIWTIIQKSRIKNSCMILLICPSPIMHTHTPTQNCTAACLQHLDLVNVDWRSHTPVSVCSYKVFAHIKTFCPHLVHTPTWDGNVNWVPGGKCFEYLMTQFQCV